MKAILKEYMELPEMTMAELIDGVIYYIEKPTRLHQKYLRN